MTDVQRRRVPWFGIILIIIGVALLIHRFGVYHIEFSYILWSVVMIYGAVAVVRGFSGSQTGRVFFGTVLFLYGLYFLLRTTEYVELRGHMFIPATFIITGFAFIMMFLNNPREWTFLVPAAILVGFGAIYILSDTGFLSPWDVRENVRLYWPVALILIGVAILFRRRIHSHKEDHLVETGAPSSTPDVR